MIPTATTGQSFVGATGGYADAWLCSFESATWISAESAAPAVAPPYSFPYGLLRYRLDQCSYHAPVFDSPPPLYLLAGTQPVCRFYIPPQDGDSHFYSASPAECALTATRFADFAYESADVFRIATPDTTTGACAAGTVPVYRVWNQRTDSNHRYTTSRTVRDQMIARGYAAEGYGPDTVIMCAAP